MSSSTLTPLQTRVLEALAGLEPPWTLTGGAALAGFHLGHRATRDLDLFVHGRATLEDYVSRVVDRLRAAGLDSQPLQSGAAFHRLQVRAGGESVLLDLVAEPVASIDKPIVRTVGHGSIQVDTAHEILVNKLCTLIQRTELRDLVDVEALLAAGGDFERAVHEAPRKDGGFSPLVLTWQLKGLSLRAIAKAESWSESRITAMEHFVSALIARLAKLTRPA